MTTDGGNIRELLVLTVLACICLGLSWLYDETMFATVFAVEAGLAATEAAFELTGG